MHRDAHGSLAGRIVDNPNGTARLETTANVASKMLFPIFSPEGDAKSNPISTVPRTHEEEVDSANQKLTASDNSTGKASLRLDCLRIPLNLRSFNPQPLAPKGRCV